MVVTLISNACISEPNVCLKTHAYCKMSLPRSRQFLQLLKNCHQKMGVEEVDICSWFLEMVILHEIYVKRTSNEQHWNTRIKLLLRKQLLKNCHQKMGVEEVDICSWFLEMVILHEIYVKRTSNEQHWNTRIKIWHHCACLFNWNP